MVKERDTLLGAIKKHGEIDILDDDELYKSTGLPPVVDRCVGNKFEMLKNCTRFVDKRCEEGIWPTYKELEDKIKELRILLDKNRKQLEDFFRG